ncbi:hypothetical protein AMELA_G00209550 [Ameiurus melas]|uniref:Uncharacterized protein n=1 Tax=Ameiurus melas TaxID=219545 RepID=A0A7J6A490_AMEME|nr:hypothetical protein AMELA_G00209550 [Ameiurus melas]
MCSSNLILSPPSLQTSFITRECKQKRYIPPCLTLPHPSPLFPTLPCSTLILPYTTMPTSTVPYPAWLYPPHPALLALHCPSFLPLPLACLLTMPCLTLPYTFPASSLPSL